MMSAIATATGRRCIEFAAPRSPIFRESDLEGPGLGGNESTCVLWARELARRGHQVAIYAPGAKTDCKGRVAWYPLEQWGMRHADVSISMRDPGPLARAPYDAVRMLYLGDRQTPGIDQLQPGGDVELLWFNSQHQISLHLAEFGCIMPVVSGCCGFEERLFHPVRKPLGDPVRFLHSSAPYRGLAQLLDVWPFIHQALPGSELHVTGGYALWGYSPCQAEELIGRDINVDLLAQPGVVYHGVLPRSAYAEVVRGCDILLYPTQYEETCCIAVLEASAAGVVPVVSAVGALTERVRHRIDGILVDSKMGPSGFAEAAIDIASDAARLGVMSAAAALSAQDYTIERMVDLLERALESCRRH